MALDALAFEIGIKESKNSELNSILTRLNQLSGKTVTIDVKGVPELNQLLNRLGHDSNGFTFRLPDLSQFMEQVKSVKSVTESMFAKQNAGDLSSFQAALSQMKELSAAIEKLKSENLSLQSGYGSDIFSRFQKMGTALNSAFSDIPNVNIQTMATYMKQLTSEYMKFIAAVEQRGGMKNFSQESQKEIDKVVRAYKELNDVGGDSTALKAFQQQVRAVAAIIMESIGNVVSEINAVKRAIQHDNFSSMTDRINKASEAIGKLDENFKKFHLTIGQDEGMRNFMTGLGEVIRNVRTTMGQLEGSKTGVGLTDFIKSMERAKYEAYQIDNLLKQASHVSSAGMKYGDTSAIDAQIEKVRKFRAELEILKTSGVFNGMTTSEFKLQGDYKIAVDTLKKMVAEQERAIAANLRLDEAAKKASQGVRQLNTEEQRLAQSIVTSTSEMFGQSQILSELKSMATQYLGVWGAQQFLRNIIQIGGQLEMQRLSIAAILGDAAQADDLFEKIKGLAVKSPFGVVELDQMTKQLTAYGFQYHELFDMTKRLADISAATGTDVGRLALALGHVRSETALTGYTLRQFSMANIPLAQKLSDRLSEIEKRFVSVAEVRKRTRNKEISYEDVLAVLKDLTDEGGMFYNAQEVISGSVKAKFKNLRDAMDIMYGEMAKSKLGDALNEVAVILTTLTREWEKLGIAVAVVAATWATKKGVSFLNANAMLAYSNSVTRLNMALGSLTAEEMRDLAYSGQLTKQRLLEAVATGKVTVEDAKLAAAKWGLTEAQLQEIAMGSRTVASMTANSIATSKYSMAQLRAVASMRTFTLGNKTAALWLNVVTTNAKMAGAAMLGFLKAAWPVALITAGAEAWMHYKQQGEQAAEAASAAFKKGEEGVRNLKEAIEKLPELEIVNGAISLDDGALRNGIKEAVKQLKNYNPAIANDIIAKANETNAQGQPVMNLADQYKYLREQVEATRRELEEYQRTSGAQETALKATGCFMDDNVLSDINDYFNERKNFVEETNKFYAEYQSQVRVAIDAAREEDAAYRQVTDGMSNYADMLRLLITQTDEAGRKFDFSRGYNVFWNKPNMQTTDFMSMWGGVGGQFGEMSSELDKWANGLKATLEGSFGYDFSHLTLEQLNNVRRHIWEFSNSEELANLDEQTRKWIRDYLGRKWNITFGTNVEQVLKDFDEMQNHIEQLVGKEWVIKLKLEKVDSFESLFDQLDKNVKDAKDTMKKLGTAFSEGRRKQLQSDAIDDTKLTDKEKEYRDAYLKLEASKSAAEKEGFKLTNLEDKKTGGRGGSQEDKEAKELRERMRILREAADSYKYWRKAVGESGAEARVNEEFGEILKKLGFTFKDIKQLRKTIEGEIRKYEDIYDQSAKSGKNRPQLLESIKEGKKTIANIKRDDYEKEVEDFASRVQIEIDALTRAWETFNTVRDETGDVDLAVKLSGVNYESGRTQNIADALKQKVEADFKDAGGEVDIDFNADLSDREIKSMFENAIPQAAQENIEQYEERISGLVEEYKKWRDLQRDIQKDAISAYARMISDAISLKNQTEKINSDYQKQIDALKTLLSLGKISPEEYQKRMGQAESSRKVSLADSAVNSFDWSQSFDLFGNVLRDSAGLLQKKLNEYISQEDFGKLSITDQKKYLDLQEKLSAGEGKAFSPFNISEWKNASEYLKTFRGSVDLLIKDFFVLQNAEKELEDATRHLEEVKGTEAEASARAAVNLAKVKVDNAKQAVEEDQSNAQKSGKDFKVAAEQGKRGLELFSESLNELTTGKLSDFAMGIANLINLFNGKEGNKSLAEAVGTLLGESGSVVAGIIGAILQIIDAIGEDAGGFVGGIIDSIFNAVTGLLDQIFSGELVEKIVEAIIRGVGNLIGSIVSGVFDFGKDGGILGSAFNIVKGAFDGIVGGITDAFYDNDTRDEADAAIVASNKILESIDKNVDKIASNMKESFGLKAIDEYNKLQSQYRQKGIQYNSQIQAAGWAKYGSRHSEWYYRNSNGGEGAGGYVDRIRKALGMEQGGYGTAWQGLFNQLQDMGDEGAHLLNTLRYNAQTMGGEWAELWHQIDETGWDDEGRISRAANAWADAWDQMEENARQFREQMAGTSFDTVFSEFMDGLYEVANGAEDVFDDIAKNWKKMINKMVIRNLIGQRVMDDLQKWYDNTFAPWFQKTGGQGPVQEVYDPIENIMKGYVSEIEAMSNLFKIDDGDGNLRSSIKGITEQTADILAAYLNAIRADVAVNRALLTRFVNEYWTAYVQQMTGIHSTLENIDANVSAIRSIISENGALYDLIADINDHLSKFANGYEQVHVK